MTGEDHCGRNVLQCTLFGCVSLNSHLPLVELKAASLQTAHLLCSITLINRDVLLFSFDSAFLKSLTSSSRSMLLNSSGVRLRSDGEEEGRGGVGEGRGGEGERGGVGRGGEGGEGRGGDGGEGRGRWRGLEMRNEEGQCGCLFTQYTPLPTQ